MKNKLGIFISLVLGVLGGATGTANAELIPVPTYSELVSASSTAFASSFFTDLIPWIGLIVIVVIVGMIASKLISLVVGAARKLFGGRRRGGGGRRRR